MSVNCWGNVDSFFFFFLIDKKQIYKEIQIKGSKTEETLSTRVVYKRDLEHLQQRKRNPPKNYLLPNHVKKSITECVLSTLYRLVQDHKLVTKLALILWAKGTSFSNTNLFLARQRFQNRHNGAANQIFLRFLPTAHPCQARRV